MTNNNTNIDMDTNKGNLAQLPPEVLQYIFNFFGDAYGSNSKDLLSISLVCSSWHLNVNKNLYSHLRTQSVQHVQSFLDALESDPSLGSHLRTLDCRPTFDMSDKQVSQLVQILEKIVPFTKNLSAISLGRISLAESSGLGLLELLCTNCPLLKSFTSEDVGKTSPPFAIFHQCLASWSRLEKFSVSLPIGSTGPPLPVSFPYIVSCQLHTIDIHLGSISSHDLQTILASSKPTLKSLKVFFMSSKVHPATIQSGVQSGLCNELEFLHVATSVLSNFIGLMDDWVTQSKHLSSVIVVGHLITSKFFENLPTTVHTLRIFGSTAFNPIDVINVISKGHIKTLQIMRNLGNTDFHSWEELRSICHQHGLKGDNLRLNIQEDRGSFW